MLLSPDVRPLRIALAGGCCAALQLGLFVALLAVGTGALPADITAFLLGAQAGFLLSDHFVWHDRWSSGSVEGIWRRWLAFHATLAGPFALNVAVFVVGRLALPTVLSAASGIVIAAVVAFIIQDALAFG